METAIGITFVILVVALIISWTLARAREVRDRWVRENGFELEAATYCWFWRGPFLFRSTDSQVVYRIAVRGADGRRREGWLRCGGFFSGLFGSQAKVIWEDE